VTSDQLKDANIYSVKMLIFQSHRYMLLLTTAWIVLRFRVEETASRYGK